MAVHYERDGAVAVITIDRPERRNAVDRRTAAELLDGFQAFVDDDASRVLVVTGRGGCFCAGADLRALDNDVDAPGGPMGFTRLHSPKPTIAAIEGWCVAGGLEIALFCDLRIAARGATFGCLERRWGVPLIDGGTQRLPRVVGLGRALDLILTGRSVDVDEAERIGLVTQVVEPGGALARALVCAREIAEFPWPTVLADRAATYGGLDRSLGDGLAHEAAVGKGVLGTGAEGAARFRGGAGRHGA